ncbi:MAG: DHHW family protein [Faecalibacterium sp.]|jgi:hypothetical protein|nr:DHHW family protein [Faecalibacterium sp.]
MENKAKNPFLRMLGGIRKYPVTLVFFGFLVVMYAADLISPFRSYSELENTKFQQRPTITLAQVFGKKGADKVNTFFKNYETFVKQQFTGRDNWISLQSRCETLLFQKQENGNVLLGRDSMEFARTYGLVTAEQTNLPKNIAGVSALGERYPGKVYLLLAPSAATIYPENVPANAPLIHENEWFERIYGEVSAAGVTPIDVRSALEAHKDKYLYYRTDHHWTTDGAWYAYASLCDTLGLAPFDRSAHTVHTVENFYGTNYSKSRQWNAVPDTISYYDVDSDLTVYKITGADSFEAEAPTGLYETEKFDTYDKYAAFLYGNNGYSRLSGHGTGSILVIKDSYANSFAPYLTDNYENVDVVDLRAYNYSLDPLIQANNYDAIVVLYSFSSFKSDTNLYKVGVAG